MPRKTLQDTGGPLSISYERLRQLLDAYGGNPDRWPQEEREAALALLETSPEARAARDRAADLDAILDRAPAEEAPSDLATRILNTAPTEPAKPGTVVPFLGRRPAGRRTLAPSHRRRRWRLLVPLVPLAAAAAALLIMRTPEAPPPRATQLVIAELGSYVTPTDVLLDESELDLIESFPSFGCTPGELGCPELDLPNLDSTSHLITRRHA
jgi:hypothetical protein